MNDPNEAAARVRQLKSVPAGGVEHALRVYGLADMRTEAAWKELQWRIDSDRVTLADAYLDRLASDEADQHAAEQMRALYRMVTGHELTSHMRDAGTVIGAALAELAKRKAADERERVERAKPADIDWLATIPGSTWFPEAGLWSLRIGLVVLDYSRGAGWWTIERVQIWPGQDATRGMVTDLLKALGAKP